MQVSFGQAIVVKTKNPNILKALETADKLEREDKSNPTFRYEPVSASKPDVDGFFKGLLCDDAEKDALRNVGELSEGKARIGTSIADRIALSDLYSNLKKIITRTAASIEVSSIDELKEWPPLKNVNLEF